MSEMRPSYVVGWTAAGVVAILVGALLWRSIYVGHAHSYDSMLYSRSLWGLAHGDPINSVVGVHALAIHGHFGLLLLVPFAWWFPAAAILLFAQALSLAITLGLVATAVGRLARERELRWSPGVVGAAVLLASLGAPLVINPFLFDVRPDLMAVPVATWALLRIERVRRWDAGALLALAVAALIREEMVMIAIGALISIPLGSRFRWRAAVAAIFLAYWLFYWFVVRGWLGGDLAVDRVSAAPQTLLGGLPAVGDFVYKLEILVAALLGMGAFVLNGWRWLGAAALGLSVVLLQSRSQADVLNFHYGMFATPGLLVAGVAGLRSWLSRGCPRKRLRLAATIVSAALVFGLSSACPLGRRFQPRPFELTLVDGSRFRQRPALEAMHRLANRVPGPAGLAMQFAIAAEVADRSQIWRISRLTRALKTQGKVPDGIQYVLLQVDSWSGWGRELVENHGFKLVEAVPGVVALFTNDRDAPTDVSSLARVDRSKCAKPLGTWPEVGLELCVADRFRDGRLTMVLSRRGPASASLRGVPLVVGLRVQDHLIRLVTLDGIFNPSQLPVGLASRLLAEAPPVAMEGVVVLGPVGGTAMPAISPGGAKSDGIPVHIPAWHSTGP